ncbi:MAG: CpaF family protein [Microthrixaceae bacterium]
MQPEATRRELVDALHARVLASDELAVSDPDHLATELRNAHPLLTDVEARGVADAVAARALGLGQLDPILLDRSLTEIMVNGDGTVWVERAGHVEQLELTMSTHEVELLVERVLGPLGLRADRTSPIADARLPDGSRVNVVVPPLAVDGPTVTIRRFGARQIPLPDLCPPGVAELLAWAVTARCSIVVSGGTGAGKTTLLNALAGALPRDERIVTIEDTAELALPLPHVVRLEARPATPDGLGAVDIRSLVRTALRMRPDRIVVGEVRGPEALDMLWAMNAGHDGSLSTCHANSPLDALRRLEVMVLSAGLDLPLAAVRDQLCSALDLVVQVARQPNGARKVVAVDEVLDAPAGGDRVRRLADVGGLAQLPERPVRARGVDAPDPAWCR